MQHPSSDLYSFGLNELIFNCLLSPPTSAMKMLIKRVLLIQWQCYLLGLNNVSWLMTNELSTTGIMTNIAAMQLNVWLSGTKCIFVKLLMKKIIKCGNKWGRKNRYRFLMFNCSNYLASKTIRRKRKVEKTEQNGLYIHNTSCFILINIFLLYVGSCWAIRWILSQEIQSWL